MMLHSELRTVIIIQTHNPITHHKNLPTFYTIKTSGVMAITDMTAVLLLIIVVIKLSTSDDLILSKQDIVHPTSGLLLQYKSFYRPGNKIVALSTVIPMVADMCYLIPVSSLNKIDRCNLTTEGINVFYRRSGQKPQM